LAGGFFYLVCTGTSLFGLLNTRSAQRLGHISYSIYLLQGIVLTLAFAIPSFRAFAFGSPAAYWIATGVCVVVLVFSSALSYVLLERPGIRAGKRLARWTATRSAELEQKAA
jgi:peptidoglycan/LPS O-acetylase OafA/YrhL